MSLSALLSDERAIIAAILDASSAAGLLVSVYDGEGYAVRLSSDQTAIRLAIGATGETTLRVCKASRSYSDGVPSRELVGWVYLVHGNGSDVISDYSDNPETAGLLAPALALADRLAVVS